jgi:hypothetical protein
MPRWIYNVEPELAPPGEQRVATLLAPLSEEFTIRWGFYYTDGISREGDFVIQGPDGHVLVMEAKSGAVEVDPQTGRWRTSNGKNPFVQLDDEWRGVVDLLEDQADKTGTVMPFIDRVLALPDVSIATEQTSYQGQPRDRIAAAGDLEHFSSWWKLRFGNRKLHSSIEEARQLFGEVFATSVPSGATHHTLDFADRIIEQQTRLRFEILDALSENRQLLFSGGPGTGKTWLAIEQATRWAKDGKRVLVLCYNLELEIYLKAICPRRDQRIEVLSFQSLAAKLLGNAPDGMNSEQKTIYYETVLPEKLLELTGRPGFLPEYDALVVDEAQDHDTAGGTHGGWWGIYLRLLKQGGESPVAIFYDRAQRLPLRKEGFDPAVLKNILLQPVSARLHRPVRYTRQLRRFLARLNSPTTAELLRDFQDHIPGLPEGPEPEVVIATSDQEEAERCAKLIQGWLDRGLARKHEVAVLFPSSRRPPAWLGKIHRLTFDGSPNPPKDAIRAISVHKAKGLERRAIVLVGFAEWDQIKDDAYKAMTYIMGATRAQNLLGIVARVETGQA